MSKDEPWRGDPDARRLHLEAKLSRQKERITELDALYAQARADARVLALVYTSFEAWKENETQINEALARWAPRPDAATEPPLKPCPWCGPEPTLDYEVDQEQGTKWGYVRCPSCAARGPEVRTGYRKVEFWAPDAAREWNRRHGDEAAGS